MMIVVMKSFCANFLSLGKDFSSSALQREEFVQYPILTPIFQHALKLIDGAWLVTGESWQIITIIKPRDGRQRSYHRQATDPPSGNCFFAAPCFYRGSFRRRIANSCVGEKSYNCVFIKHKFRGDGLFHPKGKFSLKEI